MSCVTSVLYKEGIGGPDHVMSHTYLFILDQARSADVA